MTDRGVDQESVDLNLLRRSAREFLAGRGDKDSIKDLAAMDWTGLLVGEHHGGAGWRPVETCVIAEELGRAQDRTAWVGTVLAAAAVAAGPDEIRQHWLPGLLTGAATAAVITADTRRVVRGDEVNIVVLLNDNGIQLVEGSAVSHRRRDVDALDVARPLWSIDIDDRPNILIGSPQRADQLAGLARVLVAADSVGAVSMTLERLTTYLKERTAFGAPIASFQAIQHRLVELFVFEVKARAVVLRAARAFADNDPATVLAAAAHAFVAANATAAVDECMQLSGGIGFTWEYPLHHELRRVFVNSHLVGSARASRSLLAEVAGW